ncbi:hypothetical protein LINGRAHAP2_LOCUS10411 [Linum grandiflorum]
MGCWSFSDSDSDSSISLSINSQGFELPQALPQFGVFPPRQQFLYWPRPKSIRSFRNLQFSDFSDNRFLQGVTPAAPEYPNRSPPPPRPRRLHRFQIDSSLPDHHHVHGSTTTPAPLQFSTTTSTPLLVGRRCYSLNKVCKNYTL